MARKLTPEEASVFKSTAENADLLTDADVFVRRLLEKQNEPFDLAIVPEAWLKGTPPGSRGF
ncbi:MAG TPA: hypothetical protein GYA07_08955 [Verrucomicrobia bacterium]|nr:hypothetical protein [Verrucomicrobiota bacterium]HOB33100.1 hypothetical protein [Verrucomicrobiota bacterium]HOP98003.1 hypothetical protein [Verrucomicrobiota bacterium]HPU54911.1 hypothetical protein [Verrucomicrobiota bacterium]